MVYRLFGKPEEICKVAQVFSKSLVGHLVIVNEDGMIPTTWSLGHVLEVFGWNCASRQCEDQEWNFQEDSAQTRCPVPKEQ